MIPPSRLDFCLGLPWPLTLFPFLSPRKTYRTCASLNLRLVIEKERHFFFWPVEEEDQGVSSDHIQEIKKKKEPSSL
ncbi:hypothetical protein NL676_017278 [Syzygium grande]|nr:hypothetical protein NL676_017278 [Syzygium grande]